MAKTEYQKEHEKRVDLCGICCKWVHENEKKSPLAVRDTYPAMMQRVLKVEFHMSKKAARKFIEDACCGNWDRIHETGPEASLLDASDYADMLRSEVWYFSDRWSWDRAMRAQWLYMRLCDRLSREVRG